MIKSRFKINTGLIAITYTIITIATIIAVVTVIVTIILLLLLLLLLILFVIIVSIPVYVYITRNIGSCLHIIWASFMVSLS